MSDNALNAKHFTWFYQGNIGLAVLYRPKVWISTHCNALWSMVNIFVKTMVQNLQWKYVENMFA